MKVWNLKLLVILLAILLPTLACRYTQTSEVKVTEEVLAVSLPTLPVTKTVIPDVTLYIEHKCVQSEGLWLRSSDKLDDNNKLLALPYKTKVILVTNVSGDGWQRVYLKQYDIYGYVKVEFLGKCFE